MLVFGFSMCMCVPFFVTRLLSAVKIYFFILLTICVSWVEMKKKISFVLGESQIKQVNCVGFMAGAGMPYTDGDFDFLFVVMELNYLI